MNKQYCIYALFQSEQFFSIEEFRKKHDPLYGKIPPHATLVFPFSFEYSTLLELESHVTSVIRDYETFYFENTKVIFKDGYCMLEISTNSSHLENLNHELYAGILNPFLSKERAFSPHITLGRFFSNDQKTLIQQDSMMLPKLISGMFTEIVLEEIQPDLSGNTIRNWRFKA